MAKEFYGAEEIDGGPGAGFRRGSGGRLVIKDAIADITLQQVLTRPDEFGVIATPNLNGDYLSDAGGRSAASASAGGNISYVTGHAVFEATHGTAPKCRPGQGEPGSVILWEMMLRHLGWNRRPISS